MAHYVDFPDYSTDGLVAILELMAKEQALTIDGERNTLTEIMQPPQNKPILVTAALQETS